MGSGAACVRLCSFAKDNQQHAELWCLCCCRENPQEDEEEEEEEEERSSSSSESDADGEREETEKRPGRLPAFPALLWVMCRMIAVHTRS